MMKRKTARKTAFGLLPDTPHSKKFLEHRESIVEQGFIKQIEAAQKGEVNRARGVLIGTAFGGTVEISLRREDGLTVFAILQPVEAIEILHQMAASLGCHLQLAPRNDFASWRNWKPDENGGRLIRSHPPFQEDFDDHKLGIMPPPAHPAQLGTNTTNKRNKEDVVAIKENINKRSTKRIPKAS